MKYLRLDIKLKSPTLSSLRTHCVYTNKIKIYHTRELEERPSNSRFRQVRCSISRFIPRQTCPGNKWEGVYVCDLGLREYVALMCRFPTFLQTWKLPSSGLFTTIMFDEKLENKFHAEVTHSTPVAGIGKEADCVSELNWTWR